MSATIKATTTIPFLSRLFLTNLEPAGAIIGSGIAILAPQTYILDFVTRGASSGMLESHAICVQLAGLWALFAFNEAVVRRAYDDLRLWKLLCAGMLLSNAFVLVRRCAGGGWMGGAFGCGCLVRE